jgi:hypothetical protein
MLCSESGRIRKESILKYTSYPFNFMKGLSCYCDKIEIQNLLCVSVCGRGRIRILRDFLIKMLLGMLANGKALKIQNRKVGNCISMSFERYHSGFLRLPDI